jgi:hypothetical protein
MTDEPKCKNCGVPWIEHLGIEGTCRKLETARTALRVIQTLVAFYGAPALRPSDILTITKRTLEETK